MKRILLALLLACCSGAVAYAVFHKTRPANKRFDCEIKWLSHKLELSPEQTRRVRALHLQHSPDLNGLKSSWKRACETEKAAELERACRASYAKLIETVSAELNAEQREKFLALIESKKRKKELKTP
jgi:hypothetical protein